MKNYLILTFICLLTICILLYLVNVYNSKKEYENSTNERMNFLKEITYEDFDNYIRENPDFILYISNSEDTEIVKLENSLKNSIIKKEYSDDMIYLNSKNLPVDFFETIKKYFSVNLNLNEYSSIPNLLIVKEGTIEEIFYINSSTTISSIIDGIKTYYD